METQSHTRNGPNAGHQRYQSRDMTNDEKDKWRAINTKGGELLDLIEQIHPTRETEWAKAKVDEALMWSAAALKT